MNTKRPLGFSLLELMVTIAVAAILLGVGIPSFQEFARNNAIAAATNDLVSATLAARAEAIKRQVPVTLCASANPLAANPVCNPPGLIFGPFTGPKMGFFVFVDENGNTDGNGVPILTDGTDGNGVLDAGEDVLLARPPLTGTLDMYALTGVISYGPNGFRRLTIAGFPQQPIFNVLYCDERGNRQTSTGSTARVVRVDQTGRGQTLRDVAEVTPAIGTIPGAAAICS